MWAALDWMGVTRVAVLAAVVSVLASLGNLIGSYLSARSLQRANARHLRELEEQKAQLQEGLDERKSQLQVDLEGRKLEFQKDLEERKTDLQESLESRKSLLQKDLERFKAEVTDDLAAQNARRAYEYEARKRLYAQVEPLLFQLFEALEGAFHAVASLCRTQRRGDLPGWLDSDGYYLRSIVHRLFLPLTILRLMQRSTTLLDLRLDPSIRLRYALLKECYLTLTDDFRLAMIDPALRYEPNAPNWQALRTQLPDVYWRQGLVIGRLDRLIDAMAVSEKDTRRSMNFGEFETALRDDPEFFAVYDSARDIFLGFDFPSRPVFGRMLMVYACLVHALMSVYGEATDEVDLQQVVSDFVAPRPRHPLRLSKDAGPDVAEIVRPYVADRIKQATRQEGYALF